MWWFTEEEDGELCLGTEPRTLAFFVIASGVYLSAPYVAIATDEELLAITGGKEIYKVPNVARRVHNVALRKFRH